MKIKTNLSRQEKELIKGDKIIAIVEGEFHSKNDIINLKNDLRLPYKTLYALVNANEIISDYDFHSGNVVSYVTDLDKSIDPYKYKFEMATFNCQTSKRFLTYIETGVEFDLVPKFVYNRNGEWYLTNFNIIAKENNT